MPHILPARPLVFRDYGRKWRWGPPEYR